MIVEDFEDFDRVQLWASPPWSQTHLNLEENWKSNIPDSITVDRPGGDVDPSSKDKHVKNNDMVSDCHSMSSKRDTHSLNTQTGQKGCPESAQSSCQ